MTSNLDCLTAPLPAAKSTASPEEDARSAAGARYALRQAEQPEPEDPRLESWLLDRSAPTLREPIAADRPTDYGQARLLWPRPKISAMLEAVLAADGAVGQDGDDGREDVLTQTQPPAHRLPRRVARRSQRKWSAGATLVLDARAGAEPFIEDFQAIAEQCWIAAGRRVAMYWLSAGDHVFRAREHGPRLNWSELPHGTGLPSPRHGSTWLWVGIDDPWQQDADHAGAARGLAAGSTQRRLQDLSVAGSRLTWLRPGSVRPVAGARSMTALRVLAFDVVDRSTPMQDPVDLVAPLMQCMSLAVRVEPGLLRALRLQLGLPAQAETLAWLHPHVQSNGIAAALRSEHVTAWRERCVAGLSLEQRRRICECIAHHHQGISPLIRLEEASIADSVALGWRQHAPVAHTSALCDWRIAARTIAHAPHEQAAHDLRRYLTRLGERVDAKIWAATPGLSEAWAIAHLPWIRQGCDLPPGLPASAVRLAMRCAGGDAPATGHPPANRWWALRQRDGMLELAPDDDLSDVEGVIARIEMPGDLPGVWVSREARQTPAQPPHTSWLVAGDRMLLARADLQERVHVDAGSWRGTLEPVEA